jgi:hypothetical protein
LQRGQEILFQIGGLDDDRWLNQPLLIEFRSELQSSLWGGAFYAEMLRRAVRVFHDDDSSPALVVQAAIIISQAEAGGCVEIHCGGRTQEGTGIRMSG